MVVQVVILVLHLCQEGVVELQVVQEVDIIVILLHRLLIYYMVLLERLDRMVETEHLQ